MLVTDLIAQDHRTFQQLFFELENARSNDREVLERLIDELDVHARAEEAVFYPAVREVSRRTDDAEAGHEHMRTLVEAVRAATPGSRELAQAILQLKQTVLNHAVEEEAGIFMDAARLGLDKLGELGEAMDREKRALQGSRQRAA